jgi:hypothetical protein
LEDHRDRVGILQDVADRLTLRVVTGEPRGATVDGAVEGLEPLEGSSVRIFLTAT